ncbi:acetate regulatory DNA binding protein FacB [Coccidioides immitis RMSCC 3703]|uniref:Acetate regulatory DNA binding protein FacB n=1 Tax=Coccidioides immitis RMSCC 3703 TaxID=454286 RepID=A0A0J8QWE4_COCIT|nr:acetate regulatory DNA binding protein FacB [Coccidioides immitis RMSCC 3703]
MPSQANSREVGQSSAHISLDATIPPPLHTWPLQDSRLKMPPRLVSDQLLYIFFQEWAPLYPVVHRPDIPQNLQSIHIQSPVHRERQPRIPQDPVFFERSWIPKLEALSEDISLSALQCYVLAEIYYSLKSDYRTLLRYRSLAVALCLQLGLHQSQKRFSFNPLMSETRKRVFWCQYSLDRFAAALTGLPVLMAESDICTEYPSDVDDENVTETGFIPTPPEQSTRISSALALFSASRILSKVLEELLRNLFTTMHSLAEMDDWLKKLPFHLRSIRSDKPLPGFTSGRAPIWQGLYFRSTKLTGRPSQLSIILFACYSVDRSLLWQTQKSASPSMLPLVDSSKHILQLLKLLEERRMSLTLSINKRELIVLSGLGVLWQSLDLSPDSKLVKEGQKSLHVAMSLLECESAEAAAEFGAIVSNLSPEEAQRRASGENLQLTADVPPSPSRDTSARDQLLQPLKTRFSFSSESDISTYSKDSVRRSNCTVSSPELSRSVRSSSPPSGCSEMSDQAKRNKSECPASGLSMDYLQLNGEKKQVPAAFGGGMELSDWEHVLSDMDNGHANIYNGIYGAGETPATFATLHSGYQRPAQAPQQQSSPMSVIPSIPPAQHGWPQGGWGSTPGNRPAPNKHGEVPSTQTTMADAYEAIMIPHNLDTMDESGADFAMTDSWIRQCVM